MLMGDKLHLVGTAIARTLKQNRKAEAEEDQTADTGKMDENPQNPPVDPGVREQLKRTFTTIVIFCSVYFTTYNVFLVLLGDGWENFNKPPPCLAPFMPSLITNTVEYKDCELLLNGALPCPRHGFCSNGLLEHCNVDGPWFEVDSSSKTECLVTPKAQRDVGQIERKLSEWTNQPLCSALNPHIFRKVDEKSNRPLFVWSQVVAELGLDWNLSKLLQEPEYRKRFILHH